MLIREPLENYDAKGWDTKLTALFGYINAIDAQTAHILETLPEGQGTKLDETEHAVLKTAYDRIMQLTADAKIITDRLAEQYAGTEEICELSKGPEAHLIEIDTKWGALEFTGGK